MKLIRITSLFFGFFLVFGSADLAIAGFNNSAQDHEINQYLTIQIDKAEIANVAPFIDYMKGYKEKIYEVTFDPETIQLTIFYTPYLKLGDLIELISAHFQDFKKISGTEI